jgi:hypothetical protein
MQIGKVLTLKLPNIQRKVILTICVMCSVAAAAILLAATLIPTYEVSAQIIPSGPQSSLLPENLFQSSGGLLSQDAADLAQNSTTTANITQLGTVPPIADQPITPPITPPITAVNEASDESDETSSSDDDDDENNSSSSNDNDDDDTGNDDSDDDDSGDDNNDGDGGSSAASGGAFATAG